MVEQQVDDFGGWFGPQLGRDGDEGLGAAGEVCSEVEGRCGGQRDRAGDRARPGWVVGRRPPASAWRSQRRIEDFGGDQRQGPQPAQPDGDGEVEDPKGEDLAIGRGGVRERGEGERGGLRSRGDRIALPGASLQAGCEAFGSTARSSPAAAAASWPGSRLGGRLASSRQS